MSKFFVVMSAKSEGDPADRFETFAEASEQARAYAAEFHNEKWCVLEVVGYYLSKPAKWTAISSKRQGEYEH